jgi:hypothetical protein
VAGVAGRRRRQHGNGGRGNAITIRGCGDLDGGGRRGGLGVKPRRVRQMLAGGELEGRRVGGVWLVRWSVLVPCEAWRRVA